MKDLEPKIIDLKIYFEFVGVSGGTLIWLDWLRNLRELSPQLPAPSTGLDKLKIFIDIFVMFFLL